MLKFLILVTNTFERFLALFVFVPWCIDIRLIKEKLFILNHRLSKRGIVQYEVRGKMNLLLDSSTKKERNFFLKINIDKKYFL